MATERAGYVLYRALVFPSLCLEVKGLDFGLEAANKVSTALAAVRETRELEEYIYTLSYQALSSKFNSDTSATV